MTKASNLPSGDFGRGGFRRDFGPREKHPARCTICHKDIDVPFQPSVYCRDCYRDYQWSMQLHQDEGHTLEKLAAIPEPLQLAVSMSSFANASGGTILIGATTTGHIIGFPENDDALRAQIQQALALITPPLSLDLHIGNRQGKRVAQIDVAPSRQAPHFVGTQWYERFGASIRIGWIPPASPSSGPEGNDQDPSFAFHRLKAKLDQLSRVHTKAFVSYSSRDRDFAIRLASELRIRGIDVWLDEWEIKVGDEIRQKIEYGIDTYDYFIILLSRQSVESTWVEKELNAAYMKEVSQKRIVVLPAKLEDCRIPLLISGKKYADFTASFECGLNALLAVLAPA